jgi:hypothetical protein
MVPEFAPEFFHPWILQTIYTLATILKFLVSIVAATIIWKICVTEEALC